MASTPIYFYSAQEVPYGCFSNFSPHGFTLAEVYWATVEHYFQAQKFAGTPYAGVIRLAHSPKHAKSLGHSRQYKLRADWGDVKDGIMHSAVLRKFETHAEIRAVLLATGDREIVENAPSDYYWGCGADGSGQNRLGKILMEVRSTL